MTPCDLLFLYFCATAVAGAAHWLKKWERRDRERQIQEQVESIVPLHEWYQQGIRISHLLNRSIK